MLKMQYRVEDLAVLILQNLPEITIEDIHKILEHIDYTRCAYLKPVFEFASAFYKQNDSMPDEDYMTLQFEQVFYRVGIPFHIQLVSDFIQLIVNESVTVRSQKALLSGNYKMAMGIIQDADKSSSLPPLTIQEVISQWHENKKEFSFGLKSGIPELDEIYKFFGYKSLNVIAAPPANFKTTVAISVAMDAILNQNLNVVYITLEDTSEIIYQDMLAAFAGTQKIAVTAEEIKRYLLPESRVGLMNDLGSMWEEKIQGKFCVLSARECDSFTPATISKKLDEIYRKWEGKLDVVIVDHFNIMNDPIPGLQLQGPQLAKYYVRYMTNLSISFGHKGFILIGLAQINREGQLKLEKGKELSGSELADTSELHRSATTVTSLYSDDTDRLNGLLKLKIIKNRLGAQGSTLMVPIYPEKFKVGAEASALNSMSISEFEKLSSNQTNPEFNSLLNSLGVMEV